MIRDDSVSITSVVSAEASAGAAAWIEVIVAASVLAGPSFRAAVSGSINLETGLSLLVPVPSVGAPAARRSVSDHAVSSLTVVEVGAAANPAAAYEAPAGGLAGCERAGALASR